jgi:CBS-domain-containing membrane protein
MMTALPQPADRLEPLILDGTTAADLMTHKVVTIDTTATVDEAVTLLTDRNLSAVPVLDERGVPVGVLSRSDIVAHDCKEYDYLRPERPGCAAGNDLALRLREVHPDVVYAERARNTPVRQIMTPVLFSIAPETSGATVVDAMLSLTVHRLFVAGEDGSLIGVISTTDILRHLHRPRSAVPESDHGLCRVD